MRTAVFSVMLTSFIMSRTFIIAQPAANEGMDTTGRSLSYPIAGSHLLRERDEDAARFVAAHPEILSGLRKNAVWGFTVGSQHTWYADKFTDGTRYPVPSTCHGVGNSCYVFVEDANWANGRVNQSIVDSVLRALDVATPASAIKGIFQTDIDTFGNPPDVDGDPRIIVLLLDIIDGYTGSGGYIAGYFTSYNELPLATSNQAEIYFLDVNPANLTTQTGLKNGLATTAHEFQHMIHYNYDPAEITFVNEGFSEIAPVICGYALRDQTPYVNETNHYLFDWRTGNNTTVLRDYSRASRFSLYLLDQFGSSVFKPIVQSTKHGIAGIDEGLAGASPATIRRFADIFLDWEVANILDDVAVDARYAYSYPSLKKAVPRSIAGASVPPTIDTVQSLAARYLSFTGGTGLNITFSSSSSSLVINAVELGTSSKRVVPVSLGTEFSEPAFGTSYSTINFVVTNTSASAPGIFQYLSVSGTTAVGSAGDALPQVTRLEQNYPNPFNPSTTFEFQISEFEFVSLKVFDLLGREVAVLMNEQKLPGYYKVRFSARGGDGSELSSGVYFFRLQTGSFSSVKKLLYVRGVDAGDDPKLGCQFPY